MQNIDNIINNSLLINKDDWNKLIKEVLINFEKIIANNQDLILQANKIDVENNNGFNIDFKIIDLIFNNVLKDDIWYGDMTVFQKDDDKKIVYGKQIMDIGNVLLINDGNTYVLLEMILRNIKAGNTTILCNSGFMYGTNKLITELIQTVLESLSMSKYTVQLMITESFSNVLDNYANLDLVIVIGDHSLQQIVLKKCRNRILTSGYENYELYIEDMVHLDMIKKICSSGLNINIYIREDINIDYSNAIIVSDLDEAIAKINYNGNRYNVGIFTNNTNNAAKFIREVKANMVTVNASPTIERILDIKQKDLMREKTIIYPRNFKLEGNVKNYKIT